MKNQSRYGASEDLQWGRSGSHRQYGKNRGLTLKFDCLLISYIRSVHLAQKVSRVGSKSFCFPKTHFSLSGLTLEKNQ